MTIFFIFKRSQRSYLITKQKLNKNKKTPWRERKKTQSPAKKRWMTNWKKNQFKKNKKKLDFSQHAKLTSYMRGRDNLIKKIDQ
jgi:hypothetical protein